MRVLGVSLIGVSIGLWLLVALSIQSQCLLSSNSYLVTFDGYYRADVRSAFIRDVIGSELVNIEKRPNLLSDFDVIEVSSCNASEILNRLSQSSRVRRVTSNNRFFGSPLSHGKYYGDGEIHQITKLLNADKLWDMGFKGQGVKVAVFDTGLAKHHPHFRTIVERTDWTNEQTADDGLGHGTFVAGIIASSNHKCFGFAPAASIYVYKVFTKKQVSFTSWFLDAFNHAILRGINVLNLSIGGPDFTDLPFMDKVWELSANNIILISAIGNDGPRFGTLNNPADQMDVIGVGGINAESKIARFSSRGMTTWELPFGYGRVKPDIVSYGASVYGSALDGSCRALSGTSVASPVVAGAVALMLSGIDDKRLWNSAVVKQALIEGATQLPGVASMFEQGAGKVNLLASFQFMHRYTPRITLIPPYVDFNECPYMWPYCSQPLYASAIPTIINVTILNGIGVSGKIIESPIWEPFIEENGDILNVSIIHSDLLWPWSGFMAVIISVSPEASNYDGSAGGRITLTVTSELHGVRKRSTAHFLLRVRIIPTPSKNQRLIWDQYRNIRYPPGYFPRDDLRDRANILDWNADHPHTNFKPLYQHLRSSGYHIEVLGEPLTCVDLSNYLAYILVDPEEEFFPEEREALYHEVTNNGLNLIVFADWFNQSVISKIRFMDENTKQWWQPETGGSNIPALNDLLELWNITLGEQVFDGFALFGHVHIKYASGTSVISAPPDALIGTAKLIDLGAELISENTQDELHEVAFLVYHKPEGSFGSVSVFGDSSCLESGTSSESKGCAFILENLLESAIEDTLVEKLRSELKPFKAWAAAPEGFLNPKRITTSHFQKYSKVISNFTEDAQPVYLDHPKCKIVIGNQPFPLFNVTFPSNFNKEKHVEELKIFEDTAQLSSIQLHDLVQFFDSKVRTRADDLDRLHNTARTQNYFIWIAIVILIVLLYNRLVIRRAITNLQMFRRQFHRFTDNRFR